MHVVSRNKISCRTEIPISRYFSVDNSLCTSVITQKTIESLRHAKQSGKPFFLYVPYNAPHYPMHAPQKYMDRFPDLPWNRQVMAAMLSAMDDSVGAIMAELERLEMSENTCTFFTSDNGPSRESRNWLNGTLDPYYGGTTGALKGHKFSLYEGGIRVPGIMHWPGVIPGGSVLHEPCASMDIFSTLLTAAGGDVSSYELDGIDLLPYITGTSPLPQRDIYWEMDRQTAMRRDQWKLVLQGQLVEGAAPENDVHLANLENDLGERHNLKDEYPAVVEEFSKSALDWRQRIETRWESEFCVSEDDITTVTY